MGEEQAGAMKEGLGGKSAVAEADAPAPAIQVFNTPIPKTKLPLPVPTSETSSIPPAKRDWNSSKLGLRVGVDALSAGAAGALVAPIITMIDKGIIENASGRNTLRESLKLSTRALILSPHRFIASKPFALVFVRLAFLSSSFPAATHFTAN